MLDALGVLFAILAVWFWDAGSWLLTGVCVMVPPAVAAVLAWRKRVDRLNAIFSGWRGTREERIPQWRLTRSTMAPIRLIRLLAGLLRPQL